MKKSFIISLSIMILFGLPALVKADEPTWFFSIPTPEVLPKDCFALGLVHADVGLGENLEVGIHGLKYRLAKKWQGTNVALGISPFDTLSFGGASAPGAYLVFGQEFKEFKGYLGIKVFPYFLFFGLTKELGEKTKVLFGFNDGPLVGLKHKINSNWWVGAGIGYHNLSNYGHFKKDGDFKPNIMIDISYVGSL